MFPVAVTFKRTVAVEEATLKISWVGVVVPIPCTTKLAVGVEELIPTLVEEAITKIETPEEEETLNGVILLLAWMLKLIAEEVALIPNTEPLSIKVEVARVEALSHLAA